jgi:hypothetical protein
MRRVLVGQAVHLVPMVGERVCRTVRVVGVVPGQPDTVTLATADGPTESRYGWDEPYRGSWHFMDGGPHA